MEIYYYVRNGHGDIIGLKDKTGTTVVTYEYDAFGNLITSTGTAKTGNGSLLREENPFRYASYFLLISFFSQNIYFNAGDFKITGVLAGMINLIFFPLTFGITGIFISIFAYFPFKYWLKIFGLRISTMYESKD
ncbi:MAG TPA: RHS repeat protein [Bacillales bacterium]|nr:RHS repeat protein [Bacillales bacterium]